MEEASPRSVQREAHCSAIVKVVPDAWGGIGVRLRVLCLCSLVDSVANIIYVFHGFSTNSVYLTRTSPPYALVVVVLELFSLLLPSLLLFLAFARLSRSCRARSDVAAPVTMGSRRRKTRVLS